MVIFSTHLIVMYFQVVDKKEFRVILSKCMGLRETNIQFMFFFIFDGYC